MVFAFLVWNRVWLQIYGYRFSGSGLKRGMKNNIFWSEIGSGFWEPCSTPLPTIFGSTPRGSLPLSCQPVFEFCCFGVIVVQLFDAVKFTPSSLEDSKSILPLQASRMWTLDSFGRYAVSDGYYSRAQISKTQKIRCDWSIRSRNPLKPLQYY